MKKALVTKAFIFFDLFYQYSSYGFLELLRTGTSTGTGFLTPTKIAKISLRLM
jgi:hypothetical protein